MPTKVFVFDWDGTIVKSNEIKDGAYFKVFPSADPKVKEIIGKISKGSRQTRYQIIREIIVALNQAGELEFDGDLEAEVQKRAQIYGEVVEREILAGEGVPGAFEMLKALHDQSRPVYLLTGTPLKPLSSLVAKFVEAGKIPPFKQIYGREDDTEEKLFKKQVLEEVMRNERVSKEEVAVIGDGSNEMEVASEIGCLFIGVTNESNHWEVNDKFRVVNDFNDFLD